MRNLIFGVVLLAAVSRTDAAIPGDFDPGYGTAGIGYSFTLLNDSAQAHDLVLFPDGSKITSGITETAGLPEPVLTRYKPDGSIDFGFGLAGHAVVSGMADVPNDYTQLTLFRDQVYLLVPAATRLYVYNYNTAGVLNTAFGTGGVRVIDVDAGNVIVDIAMQRSRIIVAGRMRNPASLENDFVLIGLKTDGNFDAGFGAGGIALYSLNAGPQSQEYFTGLAILPDFRIVAGGRTAKNLNLLDPYDFVVARINVDGSADSTFGTAAAGFSVIDFGYGDFGRRVAVYRNYQVLIAGSVCKTIDPTTGQTYCFIGTARLLHDGSLDTSWNGTGTKLSDLGGDGVVVTDVALDLKERALISHVWYRDISDMHSAGLTRYTFLGVLDMTFASGGHGLYDFGYLLNAYHTVKLLDRKFVHTCGFSGKQTGPIDFEYGMVVARHYNF